jgi:transcription elongation GreA/GreB family factor
VDLRKLDKARLIAEFRNLVEVDLQAALKSQRSAAEGATHEEAKAESDKDTRATEASYLARGQAARVDELSQMLASWSALKPRPFDDEDPVATGALVAVSDESEVAVYFVGVGGAALSVATEVGPVRTVTKSSPIGRALLGKCVGDEIEVSVPGGTRDLTIVAIA